MAVNTSRSLTSDLREGATDGSIKKTAPNRGGSPNNFASEASMKAMLAKDRYDPTDSAAAQAMVANRVTSL